MKRGIAFWVWRNLMETETAKLLVFPNGGKATIEQGLVSDEINKSERTQLWESQSRIQSGNYLSE